MPVREAVEHVSDIPWEWLHADAPGYAPSHPSIFSREHRFRFRYLPDEPIWEPLIERYGNETVWQFANEGARDLLVDASFHKKVYASVSRRVHELTGNYQLTLRSITTSGEPLKYSDWYFASIQEDTESYPNPSYVSFRQSFATSGMTLNYYIGDAIPQSVQKTMSLEGVGYTRSAAYKEHLYRSTKNGILESYNLPEDTRILLTSKGVQTIQLVYEAIHSHYSHATMGCSIEPVVIGTQYREAAKISNKFTTHREYGRIEDCPLEDIFDSALRENRGAVVFLVDPLENSSQMTRHDIGALLKAVSELSKKTNVPAYVVSDITLMAGQINIQKMTEQIKQDSKTVFISIESLFKYFSLGVDLSYLGSVMVLGDESLKQQIWHPMVDTYRDWALSPEIYAMGTYPPVNPEYMHHRARRITRNSKILIQTILEERPDIEIIWPGNNPEAHALCDKENNGFYGGMFFIKMPSEEAVDRFIKALDEGIQDGRFGSIGKRDGFGYQQTTVAPFGEYVRVSVGNEDMFLAFCQATYLINSLNAFV